MSSAHQGTRVPSRHGLDIQALYRYSFYDSLIIAAAFETGCSQPYSKDLQGGQPLRGLSIENPFEG